MLFEKIMALYRTGKHDDQPERVDVGVTTINLEVDAPDDIVGIIPESSGVTVELTDPEALENLSDASLDRLASERALEYARTQSDIMQVIDVKNVFTLFYFKLKNAFVTFFIFPKFFINKNVVK